MRQLIFFGSLVFVSLLIVQDFFGSVYALLNMSLYERYGVVVPLEKEHFANLFVLFSGIAIGFFSRGGKK